MKTLFQVRDEADALRRAACQGELCPCGRPASYKIEEDTFIRSDDWLAQRHPLTSYICKEHFQWLMHRGPYPETL